MIITHQTHFCMYVKKIKVVVVHWIQVYISNSSIASSFIRGLDVEQRHISD